jgi:hypothetical protein
VGRIELEKGSYGMEGNFRGGTEDARVEEDETI